MLTGNPSFIAGKLSVSFGGIAMDDEIAEVVREYGWYAASVSDHVPPFLYSIGLMKSCQHPELIVFGLDPQNAYALLSGLISAARAGRRCERARCGSSHSAALAM